jgi:NTE family protein
MTQIHVVLLLAPRLDNENHTKDIDFSRPAFADDGRAAISNPSPRTAPWHDKVDPLEGVIVHEPIEHSMPARAADAE